MQGGSDAAGAFSIDIRHILRVRRRELTGNNADKVMGGGASRPVGGRAEGAPSGGLASTSFGDLWLPHRRHPSAGITGTGTTDERIEDLRTTLFVLEEDAIFDDQPPNPVLNDLAFDGFSGELDRKLKSHSELERRDLLAQTEWSWQGTALHAACAGGHAEAVKILLAHGADLHAIDANGCTPLHYAALLPAVDCVAALLDAAQQTASSSDVTKKLQKLKHDSLPGNWVTHDDESVLLLAAFSRSSDLVELLLTRKVVADIDAPDICGTTPLLLAAYLDSAPCCARLVAAGASVTAMDRDGEQAFDVTNSSDVQAVLRGDALPRENSAETAGRHLDDDTLYDEGETIVKDVAPVRSSKQTVEDVETVAISFGKSVLYEARALFKYSGSDEQDDDLAFDVDDIIEVLSDHVPDWEGWSIGRTKGNTGFFPANYCERIVKPELDVVDTADTDAVRDAEEVTMSVDGGDDEGTLKEKVNRLLEERNNFMREKHHLQETALHMQHELTAARSEIEQLHEQLRDVIQKANENAAEHAKAAEAREAQLKELQTSGDPAGVTSIALTEEVLNLKDQVKTLDAQLHHAKLAEKLAQKQSRSTQLRTVRERLHWEHVEKDLRGQLSEARSAAQATARSLATCQSELAHIKLQRKVDAKLVAEQQATEQYQATKQEQIATHLLTAALRSRYKRVSQMYHAEAQQRRRLHNKLQDAEGNIRVYARIRPLLPFELERGDRSIVTTDGREVVRIPDAQGNGLKSFQFNGCFPDSSTQEDVFKESHELIQSVFDGYNVCIFAYGQSGSEYTVPIRMLCFLPQLILNADCSLQGGKTHTMYGDKSMPGLTPRAIECVWKSIDAQAKCGGASTYSVSMYMAELYLVSNPP